MFNKINVLFIIKKHFQTLYDFSKPDSKYTLISTLFVFYILPFLFLIYHIYSDAPVKINESLENILIQGYAVIGGFLITARFLLIEKSSTLEDKKSTELEKTLMEETCYNTSFGILLCFFNVILLISVHLTSCILIQKVLSAIVLSLSVAFIHTLLMIIKRVDSIFD